MLLTIIQGVSEVSKLIVKDPLKKWWKYHKIDSTIARIIRETFAEVNIDFDEVLTEQSITEKDLKKQLKKLKKEFKVEKTYIAITDFIDDIIEKFFTTFLNVEESTIDLALIEKIKEKIQIYLTKLKPVETIAAISVNLKKIEAEDKEYYSNLMQELNILSSQSELSLDQLYFVRDKIDNVFKELHDDHNLILKEIKELKETSKGEKIRDTVKFNQFIDIKIAFKDAKYKEKSFGVDEKYTIKIQVDSKIAFIIDKIAVNFEPLEALIAGRKINFDSQEEGYYIFNLPEAITCSIGITPIGTVNMKGPRPNFRYELFMKLEGRVKEYDLVYSINKSRGPFMIEREGVIDVVGNVLVGLVDKFVNPEFSKTIKKLKEEGEDKFI